MLQSSHEHSSTPTLPLVNQVPPMVSAAVPPRPLVDSSTFSIHPSPISFCPPSPNLVAPSTPPLPPPPAPVSSELTSPRSISSELISPQSISSIAAPLVPAPPPPGNSGIPNLKGNSATLIVVLKRIETSLIFLSKIKPLFQKEPRCWIPFETLTTSRNSRKQKLMKGQKKPLRLVEREDKHQTFILIFRAQC